MIFVMLTLIYIFDTCFLEINFLYFFSIIISNLAVNRSTRGYYFLHYLGVPDLCPRHCEIL